MENLFIFHYKSWSILHDPPPIQACSPPPCVHITFVDPEVQTPIPLQLVKTFTTGHKPDMHAGIVGTELEY